MNTNSLTSDCYYYSNSFGSPFVLIAVFIASYLLFRFLNAENPKDKGSSERVLTYLNEHQKENEAFFTGIENN